MNWHSILVYLINHAIQIGALGSAIAFAMKYAPKLDTFIDTHVRNKRLAALLVWGAHLAENVVMRLEASTRPDLAVDANGHLTPGARTKIKADAIEDFKALAGPEAIDLIHNVLGINSDAIDAWIEGLIEQAVGKMNSSKAQAAANIAKATEVDAGVEAQKTASAFMKQMAASGMFGEPPKTELAVVKPLPVAPAAPEPKVDLPSDKQLDDVKVNAPATVTPPSPS